MVAMAMIIWMEAMVTILFTEKTAPTCSMAVMTRTLSTVATVDGVFARLLYEEGQLWISSPMSNTMDSHIFAALYISAQV